MLCCRGHSPRYVPTIVKLKPKAYSAQFVLCPLPSPLPRGEGIEDTEIQPFLDSLSLGVSLPIYPLSPWERVRERAVSASLLWGKHQSCRQSVEFHRLFTMSKDDFVCAGMRQFLSVFRQRSSETCLSRLEQFSHGFDLVLFEFACFVASDEDFEHGAAVAVDEVE